MRCTRGLLWLSDGCDPVGVPLGGGDEECVRLVTRDTFLAVDGGPIARIAKFDIPALPPNSLAVSASAVFFGSQSVDLNEFPMTGVPSGGPPTVTAGGPNYSTGYFITSDTDGIYCAKTSGSNLVITGATTATSHGPAVSSQTIVFDDTYVYWVDDTTVGTIVKAPKAGGGTATVLASDTSPTAIAVDARSVYWTDEGGYIKSIAK
jgi:hypothetical protein